MAKEKLPFKSIDEFAAFLGSSVDTGRWGTGKAKTVEDLWREVMNGDSGLIREKNGLLRITWPVFVDVLYVNSGISYKMVEEKQVFTDGRERRRNLPGSIGEKRNLKEDPKDAAIRAVKEELEGAIPLSLNNSKLSLVKEWRELEEARSYPGLQTRSDNTLFALNLIPNQGEPRSFILVEETKNSHFNWINK